MSALLAHLCADRQKIKDSRDGRDPWWSERCQKSPCDLATPSVHKVMFGYPCLFLISHQSSDCCSQAHFSARRPPHPKSLSTLTDPLSCQILCSAAATVTVVNWHTGSGLGASAHTLHHITSFLSASEGGGALECPLTTAVLPNGECCYYALRLVPHLSSKIHPVLKAWPGHSYFPNTPHLSLIFPPQLILLTFFYSLLVINTLIILFN